MLVLADGDIGGCGRAEVVRSLPVDQQVDVPVDARFVALAASDCGNGGITYEARLRRDGSTTTVAEVSGVTSDLVVEDELIVLQPEEPLEPDTGYRVEIVTSVPGEPDTLPEQVETFVSFTTGSTTVPELTSAPGISIESATVAEVGAGSARFNAQVELSPVPDPLGLGYVVVFNDVERLDPTISRILPRDYGPMGLELTWIEPDYRTSACVRAVQIDGAGREGPASAEVCLTATEVEPEEQSPDMAAPASESEDGCRVATPGRGGGLGILALLGLVPLVRRRRA